jgi:hypothetical protein
MMVQNDHPKLWPTVTNVEKVVEDQIIKMLATQTRF